MSHLLHKLDDRISQQLWSSFTELLESDESGVGVAKDTMAIARNDLTALQGLPEELLDAVVGDVVTDFLAHVELPA